MAASNGMAGSDAVPQMTPAARYRAFDTGAPTRWLGSMTGILLLAALWEVAPRAGWLNANFFPPLSMVLGRLSTLVATEEFWGFVASTIRTCVLGLAIDRKSVV